MKKVISFLVALALFLMACIGLRLNSKSILTAKRENLIYYNIDSRNSCKEALAAAFENGGIPVFGSSELAAADEVAYPPSLFHNGHSDFNMVLMGRGYMQSLHHAISLGGLSDSIPDKKAVLILSPQWFTASHLTSEIYAGRFSERMYSEFLKNPKLSYATKEKVTERVKSLLTEDPSQLERVEKYEEAYLGRSLNPLLQIEARIYDSFMGLRQLYLLEKELRAAQPGDGGEAVRVEDIDFGSLMEKAEQAGREACTNNSFYIYDEYYDTYIRDGQESRKGSSLEDSYLESPEYGDLRLFLDVCKEAGIEPLVVSIPVNGRWYDWTGFPKEDREGYYQKIRSICEEYQVPLADFSDKEYEAYFLKDIMHLGWKGWVYLDEAVYEFYNK